MYSLEDLEEAKRNFEYWSDLWAKENCDPESNKYTPEAKKASQHLSNVELLSNLVYEHQAASLPD